MLDPLKAPDDIAGDDLHQQWRAFNTALENTPDFTYIFDLQGRFTYVNRALLSLWQKPLSEAIGRNFFELDYPVDLAARLQRQIQQVIHTRSPIRDQTPFTGPSGETRHYEYIFVPVLDPDGSTSAVVGSTRDVTEQRQAEEARQKSEERLTFALEAGGGVGTWDWDVTTDRVYCNKRFRDLFSVQSGDPDSGSPLVDFTNAIHSADRANVTDAIHESIRTGKDYLSEFRIVQPDGSLRWLLARGRCHYNQQRQPTRFPGIVFDITERKKSEEALLESEQQFRTLAESIANLAWMADADGGIFWYNRRWYEFTGTTPDQMLGWGWQAVHHPAVLPDVTAKWNSSLASGQPFEMVFPLRKADGTFRDFLTCVEPLKDSHQRVVRWFGTNTDITDQRMIEEELRKKNRELEEFAYVASHDLQEPLRMVNIYTQLILKRCEIGDQDLKVYASFVRGGVAKMGALLRDLLTFSRSVHADQLAAGTADLSLSLNEACAMLQALIKEAGAKIIAGPLPKVRGETDQLSHVFQNFLSNSIKYRREDCPPVIEISAHQKEDSWVISVEDNGIGFDPQYADQIFGLFKRLHKDEYEGTGLGLAICKRIVDRYGGEIWAEGKLGEGAAFHFSLPAAHE
jgi:PAS domain S-box-containing protein